MLSSLQSGGFDVTLPPLTWTAALDILIVAILIYQLLLVVRGTRAAHILAGIGMVGALYGLSILANLEAVRLLLSYLVPYTPIAVIILFQSEIRRTLAKLGRRRFFGGGFQRPESLDEILLALKKLSQEQTGGLIVLERDIGLRTFIESGVGLDAVISRDLICSIFMPGTALHDGAVVIQKDRIAAAACFLPLTVNPMLAGDLGTRHRAAIGITEETDCLSLIVSEETGWISIAAFGVLQQNMTIEQVDERINRHFGVGKYKSERPPFETPVEQERVRDASPAERVGKAMTTLKTILHVVFRNFEWKLLSLALALLVWIAIYREPIIFTVLPAPVQFKNAPKNLEISSPIVEAVDLETRGPAGLLRNLSEKRVAIVLDFSSVKTPGERTFTIERKDTNLPSGVEMVRIIPSQLRFTFEQRTVRSVPVEPQISGTLPKGIHLVKLVTSPAELAITGPDSKVRGVTAVHTDPVDLNGITDDRSLQVTAFLPNDQLRFKESPEVTVQVFVTR